MFSDSEIQHLSLHNLSNFHLLSRHRSANSLVLHIANDNENLALKIYNGDKARQIRSLHHEISAFDSLKNKQGIQTSRLISYSFILPSICYEWIDGFHPKNSPEVKKILMECLIDFHVNFRKYKCEIIAVDAIQNYADLIRQLNDRQEHLYKTRTLPGNLSSRLTDLHEKIIKRKISHYYLSLNTVSFSDYGLHNIIECNTGDFAFIDFEFFGLDSMTKVYADLFSHPKSILNSMEVLSLMNRINSDEEVLKQLFDYLPGVSLKWAYIASKRYPVFLERKEDSPSFFEDPSFFLDYTDYLLEVDQNTLPLTYLEYKSVR